MVKNTPFLSPIILFLGDIITSMVYFLLLLLFFFANFLFLAFTAKQYNNTKRKKNITYNLNITYSPDGTYTTTIKINTNKPNITYYKHVHVTVITNTSILCYGERKENGNITMQTPAF